MKQKQLLKSPYYYSFLSSPLLSFNSFFVLLILFVINFVLIPKTNNSNSSFKIIDKTDKIKHIFKHQIILSLKILAKSSNSKAHDKAAKIDPTN